MPKRYWLVKSEPSVYSIDDLENDGTTTWEGVRNYQARNFMRDDVQEDDLVLFYHSRDKPLGVAGIARVATRRGSRADTAVAIAGMTARPAAALRNRRRLAAWVFASVGMARMIITPAEKAKKRRVLRPPGRRFCR